MPKTDLVAAVAKKAEIPKTKAQNYVTIVFDEIINALVNGDNVQITGFGTFEVRNRAARTGYNIQEKKRVEIPATKVPAFKAGKYFKDSVAK